MAELRQGYRLVTIAGIADTHTAIWYLYDDLRLSPAARAFIEDDRERGDTIGLSAITLAEIVYLAEKARIPPTRSAESGAWPRSDMSPSSSLVSPARRRSASRNRIG